MLYFIDKIFSSYFLLNYLRVELLWWLTSHSKSHVWENSSSWIIVWNAINQSDCEGFLKVQQIKNQYGYEIDFLVSESQINWVWSDIARYGQIISKLYIRNIFKRQIWSSFICILNAHKKRVLWNHCRLVFYHCFIWSVQHFS